MDDATLRVARSRILAVRRAAPDRFTAGDEAVVELPPGLLRFLTLRDEAGRTLGEGCSPEWVVGVGAAGTAGYAVVEPEVQGSINCWTGITNEIVWRRAARPDETLHAFCRLSRLRRTSANLPYRVFSRERGDLVVEGEFVFVNVAPSGPRPFVAEFFGVPVEAPPAAPSAPASFAEATVGTAATPELIGQARIRSRDGRHAIHPLRLETLGTFEGPREVVLAPPAPGLRLVRVARRGSAVASVVPSPDALSFTAETPRGYEVEIEADAPRDLPAATTEAWWTPAPYSWEETAEDEVDLFRLERPRVVRQLAGGTALQAGDRWEWLFPVDLFRLLVNPVGGNTAPIGRRLHPYGRLAEGMAVHAALAHAGPGWRPRSARVHWILPITAREDFRLVAALEKATTDELTFATTLHERERHVTSVDVTLARG